MGEQPTHDAVNHPQHYTSSPARCSCGQQIECIQVTEHMSFSVGNAVKYLWRADLKGAAIEDLRKAAWYVQREIAKREAARPEPVIIGDGSYENPFRPEGVTAGGNAE